MGDPADLVFNPDGSVAWNRIWADFCDLALAGGPPHRGAMLQFGSRDEIVEERGAYERVVAELIRALPMVTGWPARRAPELGRVELLCPSEDAAEWMEEAILAENVMARRDGASILVPAAAEFRLKFEIKNVVTAVAKTFHYWDEHRAAIEGIRQAASAARSGSA
jgi:sirohydrochlorin cobaltochelatase